MAEAPVTKPPVNECWLRGRIRIIEKTKKNTIVTVMDLPAINEWARPQTVKVLSLKRIGDKDDVITVQTRPCGYLNVQTGKRPNADGGLPTYNNVEGYFEAIE